MLHHMLSLGLAASLVAAAACSRTTRPADSGATSGSALPGSPGGGSAKPPGADAECPSEDCGPAMGLRNQLCPDGTTVAGPSGRCLRRPDGSCGWEVVKCP